MKKIITAGALASGLTVGLVGGPASADAEFVVNHPNYQATSLRYDTKCSDIDPNNFKVTKASIYMWAHGNRIKGFQFKYRFLPAGTEGQPQFWSNWSDTAKESFDTNQLASKLMVAGPLGQSFSSGSDWEMEIWLKYPRSWRPAHKFKMRFTITEPECGLFGPGGGM